MAKLHEIRDLALHTIQNGFGALGFFVGNHSLVAILLPILLTLISCGGLLNIQINDNIKDGYTSSDAPSRIEEATWNEFTRKGGSKPYVSGVFIHEKNDTYSSMINTKENLDETLSLMHHITHDIRMGEWDQWSFSQICAPYCSLNEPLSILRYSKYGAHAKLTSPQTAQLMTFGHLLGDDINVTYPQSNIAGMNVNMAFNAYGITNVGNTSTIQDAHLLAIWMRADVTNKTIDLILREFEAKLLVFINTYNADTTNALELVPLADHMVNDEVLRGGVTTMPYFLLGFAIMFAFVLLTVQWQGVTGDGVECGMFLVCFITVLSPCMASLTTLGFTLLFDVPINVMMLVVPILILAIGVDDAFLLIHSWREHKHSAYVHGEMHPNVYGTHRLSLTYAHIGVSVTLTSLTNALAFLIGALMPIFELRRFCLVAAGAITIDWLYQLSFFAAIMKLSCQRSDYDELKKLSTTVKNVDIMDKKVPSVIRLYACWLVSWSARVLWIIVVIGHTLISILGVMYIAADMDPTSLVPFDSILAKAHGIHEKYVWAEYNPMVLIIQPVPDLHVNSSYSKIYSLTTKLESLPLSIGKDGTMLWLNDYLTYKQMQEKLTEDLFMDMSDFYDTDDDEKIDYEYYSTDVSTEKSQNEILLDINKLPEFLEMPQYSHWNDTVRWHYIKGSNKVIVDGMYCIVAYRNLTTIGDQAKLITEIRQIVADDELDATIFSLTGVVCIFFIAHFGPVVIAVVNVTSVHGYLHWWGVALDPITMAFSIMAVGFSVDYAAHLCYNYATHGVQDNVVDRLAMTLYSIGVPMTQAGISTALCMLTQWYAQLLAFKVLVKTVILVVALGLMHGLFILPVMLAFLPPKRVKNVEKSGTNGKLFLSDLQDDVEQSLVDNNVSVMQ